MSSIAEKNECGHAMCRNVVCEESSSRNEGWRRRRGRVAWTMLTWCDARETYK